MQRRVTRRGALGGAIGAAAALQLGRVPDAPARSVAATASTSGAAIASGTGPVLGRGGKPMSLAAVARVAKQIGNGEPVAIVDLAAVDHNCQRLLRFSIDTRIKWRPAYKALRVDAPFTLRCGNQPAPYEARERRHLLLTPAATRPRTV